MYNKMPARGSAADRLQATLNAQLFHLFFVYVVFNERAVVFVFVAFFVLVDGRFHAVSIIYHHQTP